MVKELEREMEDRGLASIAQAIRIVLGEHFSQY